MIFLIAFIAGFLLDFLWVGCINSVQEKRPLAAANMAVMFCVCTLVSTFLTVDKEIIAIVTYCAGNWLGTYIAVRRKK